MRNQSEILKLSILSIQDGEALGKVQKLVVDPATRKAEYLVLAGAQWYETPQLLPFAKVKSIGKDLITVKSGKDLVAVSAELKKSLAALVEVTGLSVIDSSGEYISTVADFSIDPQSGSLSQLILADGRTVDAATIVTLSAGAIIVDSNGSGGEEVDPEMQFFIGKTVEGDVKDGEGTVIIAAGTVITPAEIETARAANALFELITAVK